MVGFTRDCVGAVVLAVVAVSVAAAQADVLFVDDDNCPGPGSGTVRDPYCAIQTAIDNAVDTDEIVVAPGTYFESINFLGKAITLRSSEGADVTIIDGTGAFHVVQCVSGEEPDTVLDGFTITGGNANGLFPDDSGGGMFNHESSPSVTNCTFAGNCVTSRGGGMLNVNITTDGPTVTNCTFSSNTSTATGGLRGGGGMYNFFGKTTVIDCTFSGNTAAWRGGGMYNVNNGPGGPTVTNCTFGGNTANGRSGGGMHNDGSNPTVTNCEFSGNSAGDGAGMSNLFSSSPTVIDCTFSGNSAIAIDDHSGRGGAMYIVASDVTVLNCTFTDNVARTGGGMWSILNPQVTNCILWDNVPEQIVDGGTLTVTYSNVQGGFPGTGNIDADPLFIDPDNGDYRLSPNSPCIDAGHNWGVPPDTADLDEDGDTTELTPLDLDGNPRFVHASAQHPGCGEPAVVDMGPYEFQDGKAADIKLGDIDGDGTVNLVDMLILLASWGACEPGCCLADLDIDGDVGITDFLLLLGNWG